MVKFLLGILWHFWVSCTTPKGLELKGGLWSQEITAVFCKRGTGGVSPLWNAQRSHCKYSGIDSIKIPQKCLRKADPAVDQEEKSLTSCTSFVPCILSSELAKGLKCSFGLDWAKGDSSPAVLIHAQSLILKVINSKLSSGCLALKPLGENLHGKALHCIHNWNKI